MIFLGYARVSTEKQSLDLQLASLKPVCQDIWLEKKSGMSRANRTALATVIEKAKELRRGGAEVTIVVYSLSRLGRRLVETAALITELNKLKIGFKSMTESIDTTTVMGRAFANILMSLAECEAELLSERTKAGLAARKAAGVQLGRRPQECSAALQKANDLIDAGTSLRQAALEAGLNESTLRRLRRQDSASAC